MTWPDADALLAAALSGADAFEDPELREARPSLDAHGRPVVVRGTRAIVLRLDGVERPIALRLFLRARDDREKRYDALQRYLERHRVDALVPFEYVRRGVRVGDRWLPALKMPWIEGERLDARAARLLDDPVALRDLADEFFATMRDLARHNLAHGDLEPGNVLVTPHGLRLVDPDAAYVPGLEALGAAEPGDPHHQHPRRARFDYAPALDHFAACVLHVSLLALSLDPSLHRRFGGEGRLLLRREDYDDPDASPALAALAELPAGALLVERVREALRSDPLTVPPLEEIPLPRPVPAAPPPDAADAPDAAAVPEGASDARERPLPASGEARAFDAPLRLERASLLALGAGLALLALFGYARATPLPLLLALGVLQVALWGGYLVAAHASHPVVRERREALRRLRAARADLAEAQARLAEHPIEAPPPQDGAPEARRRALAREEEAAIEAIEREAADALEALQARREALLAQESAAVEDARRRWRRQHLDAQLARHPIGAAPVALPFAATRALVAAGARSAADVRAALAELPDMGPEHAAALLAWRRELEARAEAALPPGAPPEVAAQARLPFADERRALDAQEAQVTDEARAREEAARARHRVETARLSGEREQAERAAQRARQEHEARRARLARAVEDARRALAWAEEDAARYGDVALGHFVRRVLGRSGA